MQIEKIILNSTAALVPLVLVGSSLCRSLVNVRQFETKRYERMIMRGALKDMEEGAYLFFIVGSCLVVAGFNADLKYLWRILAGVFLAGGLITALVCLHFNYSKNRQPLPELPELDDEILRKRISKRKKAWLIQIIMIAVWIYSWREIIA